MAKSENLIKNDLISSLLANEPNADVQDGSLIRDINIDPQAVQMSYLYDENDYVKLLAAWKNNAETLTREDLDNIGSNFDQTRKSATYASTVITFRTKNKPQERIRIGNEDGTGGIQVKSMSLDNDTYYQFSTTQTVYMETEPEFNNSTGFYEVNAPATAVLAGPDSNVGVGTLIILETPISGIESVYNYVAANGGEEEQGNTDFANDLSIAIQGATKNTESGIKNTLNKLDGISEIKIFNPNSEENTDTGLVYAFVKSNVEKLARDTFTYINTYNSYKLSKRPVKRIISVKAYYNGVLKDLIQNVDFYLEKDNTSIYSYSINSNDRIVFNYENKPDNNSEIIIDYVYASIVEEGQDLIFQEENGILILGNIIVKLATPVLIDMLLDIKLKYGFNTNNYKNDILTGIQNYINSFKMGEDLTTIQLYTYLLQNFNYIETINYPFTTFKLRNGNNTDKLETVYGQYLTIDQNSIKINFN